MDLSQFDTRSTAERGIDVSIKVAGTTVCGGDDKPVMFRIKGADSPAIRQYLEDIKAPDGVTPSLEERDEKDIDLCVEVCTGWSDNATLGGKPFPYSEENARLLFAYPGIRTALVSKAVDRANFIKRA